MLILENPANVEKYRSIYVIHLYGHAMLFPRYNARQIHTVEPAAPRPN